MLGSNIHSTVLPFFLLQFTCFCSQSQCFRMGKFPGPAAELAWLQGYNLRQSTSTQAIPILPGGSVWDPIGSALPLFAAVVRHCIALQAK